MFKIYKKFLKYFSISFSSIKGFMGDYLAAINKLNNIKILEPNDPDIYWRLGVFYFKLNDPFNALENLQRAIDLGSRKPKYLLWLSNVQSSLGNIDDSHIILEEVLNSNPVSWEAWQIKGRNFITQGAVLEGMGCLNKSLNLNPKNIDCWNELGCLYLEQEQTLNALETFKKGLKIYPKHTSLVFNIGLVYLKLENYDTSLEYLMKADKFGMKCPELYNAIGICCSHLDKLETAEEYYNKAYCLCPDNSETIGNLAALKGKKSLYNEALVLYEELVKINEYDATALNNIAWCLEHSDNFDEAIKFYYRALALETNNMNFRLNLSECLYSKGYYTEAINHLEDIIKNDTKNYKAWEVLGNIYDKNKCHAKAIDCFNKALGLE